MNKPDAMFRKRGYVKYAALAIKRSLLVVVAALAVIPLCGQSLSRKVNVSGINSTVRELFGQIESQTGYTFAFDKTALDVTRRLSITASGVELRQVLDRILAGTGFGYIISNSHIIIVPGQGISQARAEESERPVRALPAGVAAVPRTTAPQQRAAVQSRQTFRAQSVDRASSETLPRRADRTAHSSTGADQSTTVTREPAQPRALTPRASRPEWTPTDPGLLPGSALKTNLLFDLTTTLSLGLEVRVSPRSTIELMTYYNAWNFKDNRKFRKLMIQPEYRFWLRDAFSGHVFGVHGQLAHFNYGNLPFGKLKEYRYQGDMYGVGISYGHAWRLGKQKHWSLEPTIGIGYNHLKYDSFDCDDCGQPTGSGRKNYFGVTKLGVNLSILLGKYRDNK